MEFNDLHNQATTQKDDERCTATVITPEPDSNNLPKLLRQLIQLEIQKDRWSKQGQNPIKNTLNTTIQIPMASKSFTEEISTTLASHVSAALNEIRPKVQQHITDSLQQVTMAIIESAQQDAPTSESENSNSSNKIGGRP